MSPKRKRQRPNQVEDHFQEQPLDTTDPEQSNPPPIRSTRTRVNSLNESSDTFYGNNKQQSSSQHILKPPSQALHNQHQFQRVQEFKYSSNRGKLYYRPLVPSSVNPFSELPPIQLFVPLKGADYPSAELAARASDRALVATWGPRVFSIPTFPYTLNFPLSDYCRGENAAHQRYGHHLSSYLVSLVEEADNLKSQARKKDINEKLPAKWTEIKKKRELLNRIIANPRNGIVDERLNCGRCSVCRQPQFGASHRGKCQRKVEAEKMGYKAVKAAEKLLEERGGDASELLCVSSHNVGRNNKSDNRDRGNDGETTMTTPSQQETNEEAEEEKDTGIERTSRKKRMGQWIESTKPQRQYIWLAADDIHNDVDDNSDAPFIAHTRHRRGNTSHTNDPRNIANKNTNKIRAQHRAYIDVLQTQSESRVAHNESAALAALHSQINGVIDPEKPSSHLSRVIPPLKEMSMPNPHCDFLEVAKIAALQNRDVSFVNEDDPRWDLSMEKSKGHVSNKQCTLCYQFHSIANPRECSAMQAAYAMQLPQRHCTTACQTCTGADEEDYVNKSRKKTMCKECGRGMVPSAVQSVSVPHGMEPVPWLSRFQPATRDVMHSIQSLGNAAVIDFDRPDVIERLGPHALVAMGLLAEEIVAEQLASSLSFDRPTY